MPDRAVVDDLKLDPSCSCKGCDGSCEAYENLMDRLNDPPPGPPRALVALSEDRQWLCAKIPDPFIDFCISERVWLNQYFGFSGRYIWEERHCVQDTGQDAHDVLADFLARRK